MRAWGAYLGVLICVINGFCGPDTYINALLFKIAL